jgi:O-antigen/teichoic acid export membrane protein
MKINIRQLKGSEIFESAHLSQDLGRKSLRAGGVTMASQGALFIINLVRSIILARLLTPEDFGLIGMVTVVVGFAAMFKDSGLSMATIQRFEITEAQVSSLFWCNVALSLVLGVLICASAPLVSQFYGKPELTLITITLAGSFVFSGLQIQHLALLRRHMQFSAIAVINVVSTVFALLVAVVMAWYGYRYWALVASAWTQSIISLVLTCFFCNWRPGKFQRNTGIGSMLKFGGHITGFNFVNFFARNLDNILIGRFLGADSLGIYQRAYTLMMQPLQNLNGPIAAVLTPSLSRLQNEPERYRASFCKAVSLLLFISIPIAAFFVVMSREIILLVLGEQWDAAVRPFMFLSICMVVQPLGNITGVLYITQGRAKEMMQWGVISSLLIATSFAVGLFWGIDGVALCYALTSALVVLPLLFRFVGKTGPVTTRDLWMLFLSKLPLFFGFVIILYFLKNIFINLSTNLLILLSFQGVSFCVLLFASALIYPEIRQFIFQRVFNIMNRKDRICE